MALPNLWKPSLDRNVVELSYWLNLSWCIAGLMWSMKRAVTVNQSDDIKTSDLIYTALGFLIFCAVQIALLAASAEMSVSFPQPEFR